MLRSIMPRKSVGKSTSRFEFLIKSPNASHVERQVKLGRFPTKSSYLNALIDQNRTGRDDGLLSLEEKVARTIENFDRRLEDELRVLRLNYATQNAFLHAFVRYFLVNSPELDEQTKRHTRGTAKQRYQRLLEQAAQMMTYEDQDASKIDLP
ncbi:hypothetical protein [Silvibacterium sp.]|uniref:hypothetical protein n=1 Tax=Silvibacterium sp. TaxID=1964179 RepID=UPI0039E2318A